MTSPVVISAHTPRHSGPDCGFNSPMQAMAILPRMHIPQYWAQVRLRHQTGIRHGASVQRWGWSDNSQMDAEAHARQRAQQALDALLSAGSARPLDAGFERMEWRGEYGLNGATPIREEVLERRGETVMTRNSYGAHCLNTEQVAIADVDFPATKPGPGFPVKSLVLLAIALPWLWLTPLAWSAVLLALMVVTAMTGLFFISQLKKWLAWRQRQQSEQGAASAADQAMARVQQTASKHPDWGLRIYRTPKGLRIIVTHATWDYQAPEVQILFKELGVDPLYAMLCERQQCFRARASAKPWRMGMSGLSSTERRWPLPPEHLQARRQWTLEYERKATQFAACQFLEQLGNPVLCVQAQSFVQWHDTACKAQSSLPLA